MHDWRDSQKMESTSLRDPRDRTMIRTADHDRRRVMADDEIPTFELDSKTAALLRLQHEIDYADAGPKSPISGFSYRGVRIESRWAVQAELETMKRIVDAMPELMARRLASIWCDSKCGANYLVSVRPGLWVPTLERAISDAITAGGGGHNGVMIDEAGDYRADLDPDWGEA